ncbi:GSCOCG00012650001-RA-CDS, partial [Cotesia congregata]
INEWSDIAEEHINALTEILKSPDLNVHEKLKIQFYITQLGSHHERFKRQQQGVVGGGVDPNLGVQLNDTRVIWRDVQSAFNRRIRTGMVVNLLHIDLKNFLLDAKELIINQLQSALQVDASLKVNVILTAKFWKPGGEDQIIETKTFPTKNEGIFASTNLSDWVDEFIIDSLQAKVDDFEHRDSGWSLMEVMNITVNINKFMPLEGGNNTTFITMPRHIRKKGAVINIKNNDNFCFLWSVVAALHPAHEGQNVSRVSSYPHYSRVLNYHGIKFPMTLKDIPKFEKMNDLSINVYDMGMDIDDMNIDDIENRIANFESKFHFALINDLPRLVSMQVSKHKTRKFFCDQCLCHF